MITSLLAPVVLLVTSQPEGYTLVYSPPRAYTGVDWMDVKAVYMKTKGSRLYFYVEYYGAIPNSRDYYRDILIHMDTDRNNRTGELYYSGGVDYYIELRLHGNGDGSSWAILRKWNSTTSSWNLFKYIMSGMTRTPGLSYMEIWVGQQDIEYTSGGIDFFLVTYSIVAAMPLTGAKLCRRLLGEADHCGWDPGDWGVTVPLATFQSRSINPPELEVSNIYVANDGENLYMRIDVRGTPQQASAPEP